MPIESARSSTSPPALAPDEVRPEELSELLDRLQDRQAGRDRMTVADVAETLGVDSAEVRRVLADVRSTKSEATSPRVRRRSRLPIAGAGVLATFVYWQGFGPGRFRADARTQLESTLPGATLVSRAPSQAMIRRPETEIARLLPRGVRVTVGERTIVGTSTNPVFPHAEALAAVLDLARAQTHPASTVGTVDHDAIVHELETPTPVAVSGVTFVKTKIERGKSSVTVYLPSGPGPETTLGSRTDRAIEAAERRSQAFLSNALREAGRPVNP